MIITKSTSPELLVREHSPATTSKPSTKPIVDSYELAAKPNALSGAIASAGGFLPLLTGQCAFAPRIQSGAADARTAQLGAKLAAKDTAAEAALKPQEIEIGQSPGANPLPGGLSNIQAGLSALSGGAAARGYSQSLPAGRPELRRAPVEADLRDEVEQQLEQDLGEGVVKESFSPRSQRDVGGEKAASTSSSTEETKEVMEKAMEGATEATMLTVDAIHVVEGVHLAEAGVAAGTLGGALALVGAASLGYFAGKGLDAAITWGLGKPLGEWVSDKVNGPSTGKLKSVEDRLGGVPLAVGECAAKEAIDRWVKERSRVSELDKTSNPVGDREVEGSGVVKDVALGLVLKTGAGHAERSRETAALRATDPVTRYKSNPAPGRA